ncbi:MAG: AIR carboxylase family protein [Merdibacter sp.]
MFIAGAGGAAHLPVSSPAARRCRSSAFRCRQARCGLDSLLSIVQMPGGIPVATTAIGKAGAKMRRSWPHR